MQRILIAPLALLLLATPAVAQPKANPPELFPPDAATLEQIETKTTELRKAVEVLPLGTNEDYRSDVEVYLKAAEWVVRHGEFFHKDSGKQTVAVLDAGLERAKWAKLGLAPWRDVLGKPVIRGYRSRVDGSVQPYSLTLPADLRTRQGPWRIDITLHGRDQTLTEVKFIQARESAKPPVRVPDRVVIEPYGRGNNAYRWAGETDVTEAYGSFMRTESFHRDGARVTAERIVLRGFSMGGAGTWHIGLHHPTFYAAISPGAGFTTTRGYVRNLPADLPEYVDKCLHIYDAADYAENVFHVPVVAYSGEKDPQKAAADTIEVRLKKFGEKVRFTHLVAPGLEHRMPPEWQDKADAEIVRHLPRTTPDRLRFVTYTTRYGHAWWATAIGLDRHYDKAILYGNWTKEGMTLDASNVRVVMLHMNTRHRMPEAVRIDGQHVPLEGFRDGRPSDHPVLIKQDGKWTATTRGKWNARLKLNPEKSNYVRGPIDDAFLDSFVVVLPESAGWHPRDDAHTRASADRFGREWDKYFRGRLPIRTAAEVDDEVLTNNHLVLFGDPGSNPLIAKVVGKLPITWTRDELVVNGVKHDPRIHVPVLIYPNPLNPFKYVVINSGHTFYEADLKGTNALLYPRLGDWAVLRPTPTEKDPAAAEVVAAGLFDEFWRFPTAAAAEELKSFAVPGAKLEKLWGDGEFTEGPTPGPDGAIYFSDIGNRILRFDPKTGKTTTYRDPSGRSNGLKFDAKGRLLACEGANTGGNRRVSVTKKNGEVRTLADRWMGKRFNSPNDLTIDAKGRVYFTDPRYVGDEPREIDTESVYRIDPDGKVTQVIFDVTKPNGIVLSSDGKTLYLAETNGDAMKRRQLLAYPLKEDGTVGAKRVLHDFGDDRGIDGMTVTAEGLIVATAGRGKTAGVYFFTPEGKKVGFVPTPEDASNCCFGGPGSKTLYVTAGKSLYRIELTVAGP